MVAILAKNSGIELESIHPTIKASKQVKKRYSSYGEEPG